MAQLSSGNARSTDTLTSSFWAQREQKKYLKETFQADSHYTIQHSSQRLTDRSYWGKKTLYICQKKL